MVPTPSQHLAAKQVLTSTITKISGIAGTGRTQTFRLLSVAWKILTAGSSDILLLACTPKAASCFGQIVGIEAITLHQALGIRADCTGWRSTTKITHGLVLLEDVLRLSRSASIEAQSEDYMSELPSLMRIPYAAVFFTSNNSTHF